VRKGDFEVEVQGDRKWVEQKFEDLTSKDINAVAAPTSSEEQIQEL